MLEHIDRTRFAGESVGVLYGGRGSERAISLKTGTALANALRDAGHEVTEYDMPEDLGALVEDMPSAVLLGMHGDGEDGTGQGLLEVLRIPYSGSGVLASALAMDKHRAKVVMKDAGVALAPGCALSRKELEPTAYAAALERCDLVGKKHVLKPNDSGSSVGVHILEAGADASAALADIAGLIDDGKATSAVLEAFLEGPEYSVGFFGDTCLGVINITPAQGFYDYHAKYESDQTSYVRVEDKDLAGRIETLALQAWRALGCRGVGRVDVMGVDAASEHLAVLEVNTIPGMTATSLVPKLAASHGISFADFADLMLCSASTDEVERRAAGAKK